MNSTKLSKATALALFKDQAKAANLKDKAALAEAWCIYTDSLLREGYINEFQCNSWTNPFH